MSEALRLCLVGATGLIGAKVIEECVGHEDVRLQAIARREANLEKRRAEFGLTNG